MSVFLSQRPVEPPRGAGAARAWRALEHGLDRICGEPDNPLRQLGGLGFYLFWLIALTGGYLYVFYDTSVDGAHASVEALTHGQWWAGGVMRSLHRYASDAFVAVIVLHLMRELMLGRFRGFRWYSWVSGVPTLWLAVAAGVIGYWMVWDTVALFVATATTEWFGALPGFGPALVRNFVAEGAVSDRLFSLVVFLHVGLPLVLLLLRGAHVPRLTQPQTGASRAGALWSLGAMLALSLAMPAVSQPPADLHRLPASLPIDWFYLAPLPAIYASSPAAVWGASIGLTLLIGVAPWLGGRARPAPAKVDPQHCNGCRICFADCPFAAIAMAPHPGGEGEIAVVDDDRCASCGICAGSCPSAVPCGAAPCGACGGGCGATIWRGGAGTAAPPARRWCSRAGTGRGQPCATGWWTSSCLARGCCRLRSWNTGCAPAPLVSSWPRARWGIASTASGYDGPSSGSPAVANRACVAPSIARGSC